VAHCASLLPSSMIASFIKRLSRLALTAPPPAIIMLIPFIYNLFKRHPGCMVMLQRHEDVGGEIFDTSSLLAVPVPLDSAASITTNGTGTTGSAGVFSAPVGYVDPYDTKAVSPFTTRAIDSSVWELAVLQHHYLASISTLAKVFSEAFTKPEFNMEDFLDHGYSTVSVGFLPSRFVWFGLVWLVWCVLVWFARYPTLKMAK